MVWHRYHSRHFSSDWPIIRLGMPQLTSTIWMARKFRAGIIELLPFPKSACEPILRGASPSRSYKR